MHKLVSTLTGLEYPFERLEEFADNGEALEVSVGGIERAQPRPGPHIWERFAEFLPFQRVNSATSLGEGNTPLVGAGERLKAYAGVERLLLKNETQNPTWSFKDRGSLACVFMAQAMGERTTATISTGNMGHSIAAYGARADLRVLVFVPEFVPREKLLAMGLHGAVVIRVRAPDYARMKEVVLGLAEEFKLRIVSGNGPIRVEGYKLTAFELYEQTRGELPDYIAVPTSACGHVRGLFKGFRELLAAGLIQRLPRMIVVQAANNSPIVSAIKQGSKRVIPFTNFHTVAEAITTGNPKGGDEIIAKAYAHGWLAEDAAEAEILEAQRVLAQAGWFVEPATATTLCAVRKLKAAGRIGAEDSVLLMLTGAGLKDLDALKHQPCSIIESNLDSVRCDVERGLKVP
ncbi:MAG TPA: threonine synthase [Candidatus Paceibacterota bacterium]|nr:threonine synthase [Verrucomicrobiota bacterium]HSA09688.1 threonine synthase [Candidatus Paceibacterota bacterium]